MIFQRRHRDRPAVVVVGLDCITGLQAARVFARRAVPVIGIAGDVSHFCCKTRSCLEVLAADTSSEDVTKQLEQLGPTLPHQAVLVPCTDLSVLRISRDRARLAEWYHIPLPSAEVVEMLLDKTRFAQFAEENGLPIPWTVHFKSRDDVRQSVTKATYPCLLKPAVKTSRWKRHSNEKAFVVKTPVELMAVYDQISPWSDSLLLQEFVSGGRTGNYTCDAYFDTNAQPVVTFTSRKLRQWPRASVR